MQYPSDRALEVLTLGRASVDLYGEQIGGRLEDMSSFAKYVGGSPTNTAIGAARLGLRAGLLSRVGDDHFGRFIREELARVGVETRHVGIDKTRLTALAILGIRDQDSFPLLFYRENCADMGLDESDIDAVDFAGVAALLISGTHLSQPGVRNAAMKAAERAKTAGARIVFDIDYRPVLWGLTAPAEGENRFVNDASVTAHLQALAPLCDAIVGTEEEFQILGGTEITIAALERVRETSGALLVCKRGALGSAAMDGAIPTSLDDAIAGQRFLVDVFNVLGAGDAFMAGFLKGWLRGESLETSLCYGNACGALVVSRHGCAPAMPSGEELQSFLSSQERHYRLREDRALEHLHWATTRRPGPETLKVLAMDHRSQFEELAREFNADSARIEDFKKLSLAAVDRVAGGDPSFGVLLDGRHGMRALERASDFPYWIGRPVEIPGSRPLEFEASPDIGVELRTWPVTHVAKCLVNYHPDDDAQLRALQEQQLLRLQDGCRGSSRELLVEIIASPQGNVEAETVARAMQRLYDIGLMPDWWKLEPVADADVWANVSRVIEANDRHCRGVLLLGSSASNDALLAAFESAASFAIVKGFAVGRSIFMEPARAWFAGALDDAGAVAALAERFQVLCKGWDAAKSAMMGSSAKPAKRSHARS